ncbi:MAG: alpha/beta fold hydrolase [Cyclobacteriaceae bacterium]|nr:alpha/beta fold hydrolase [Cyclobacteriaceae bacterium]
MQKINITSSDGYVLSALQGVPLTNSKGTVILSSATCIKKEFYINFAEYLVEKGYVVLLYDYRGIGESAPADLKNSDIYIHEWGTKDMNAVLNYVTSVFGTCQITWFGHSIGSQLMGFIENSKVIQKAISLNAAVGYWKYFPFPKNIGIWMMWYVIGPLMIKIHGYGMMKKIGWGEDLTKNSILEWREWCINKDYFMPCIREKLKTDRFDKFEVPITALYMDDDYIANDITVPLMMEFFPNAAREIKKIKVSDYTVEKAGHVDIFRKKFEYTLWPLLVEEIENKSMDHPVETRLVANYG